VELIEIKKPLISDIKSKQVNSGKSRTKIKLDLGLVIPNISTKGQYIVPKSTAPVGSESQNDTPLTDDKFVYASFFDRIRTQLDAAWQGWARDIVIAHFKATRVSFINRTTRVLVTLDALGNLVKIHVIEASDNEALDKIALEAFKQAGQFTHPPKGLVRDGFITFDWTFVVRSQR
jgi:TonB family protein